MQKLFMGIVVAALICAAGVASAAGGYNDAPWTDGQVKQCLNRANESYTGGNEPSNVRGQDKAHAWCECLWNETPDSFGGDLVKYSVSHPSVNKMCEKHSGWK